MNCMSTRTEAVFEWSWRVALTLIGLSITAPVFAQPLPPPATPACTQCRNAQCRNYQGSGLDVVGGCFEKVNPALGANPADPTFLQECIDVVSCAYIKNCSTGPNGLAQCYCGSALPDACINSGPAADAACLPQVQHAARATSNADVTQRLSDLAYPVGWAFFLLECDRSACASACMPGSCGNRQVEAPAESCDDGNRNDNDGCSSSCKLERCGDGIKQTNEACDDGNQVDNDGCTARCQLGPNCGNGRVETGEQCDDGNRSSNDGCSQTCRRESCGDGIRQANEECDDGNRVKNDLCNNACRRTKVRSACSDCRDENCRDYQGSGLDVFAGCFEAVDASSGADPNDPDFLQDCIDLVTCAQQNNCAYGPNGPSTCYCGSASTDACITTGPAPDAPCVAQVQQATRSTSIIDIANRFTDLAYPSGWANYLLECDATECEAACVPPATVCGNRVIERPTESCDDGNRQSNDGCSATCQREICGDGIKQAREECDDGNKDNRDQCGNNCKIKKGSR